MNWLVTHCLLKYWLCSTSDSNPFILLKSGPWGSVARQASTKHPIFLKSTFKLKIFGKFVHSLVKPRLYLFGYYFKMHYCPKTMSITKSTAFPQRHILGASWSILNACNRFVFCFFVCFSNWKCKFFLSWWELWIAPYISECLHKILRILLESWTWKRITYLIPWYWSVRIIHECFTQEKKYISVKTLDISFSAIVAL